MGLNRFADLKSEERSGGRFDGILSLISERLFVDFKHSCVF